ncbi:extracellular signal-regulated protein kinase [Planoprotostelium fungivorum]|uniref:Mitogen-activated protein kinase n=1 Tax=Planoprotostelium fungivorum TaxID=1890364 RepID=A0A2P6N557_9EUKA|nr:extracellular signal-regulated protein kinase [Planoprotostelium fungivorum]
MEEDAMEELFTPVSTEVEPSGYHIQSYLLFGETRFDLPPRYTPLKTVGRGAYGVVIAAKDNQTSQKVAIKKISKAFENLKDTKRILREIKLLRHFSHENVLSITDMLRPPSKARYNDVYLVTELMETDLQQIITSNQPLSEEHIQYFLYQILRGLKAIHSAHVLHRDLKPSNLLVNSDCLLKICDLGLARVANPDDDWNGFMTEYVATRWYRAPEVILSWKQYTKAIDVWSVGCIFAELLGRKPLFQGKDYIHQITKIADILGTPPEDEIMNIRSEPAQRYIRQMGYKPKVSFQRMYPNCSPPGVDLLERMLAFDPAKRCTVEQALEHPYLATLHDPEEEPVSNSVFNFDFENYDLNKENFQEEYRPRALHGLRPWR